MSQKRKDSNSFLLSSKDGKEGAGSQRTRPGYKVRKPLSFYSERSVDANPKIYVGLLYYVTKTHVSEYRMSFV